MLDVPAGVAQLAERPSCKRQVSGSIPLTGSQWQSSELLQRIPLRPGRKRLRPVSHLLGCRDLWPSCPAGLRAGGAGSPLAGCVAGGAQKAQL